MPNTQYALDLFGRSTKTFFFIIVLFGVSMVAHSASAVQIDGFFNCTTPGITCVQASAQAGNAALVCNQSSKDYVPYCNITNCGGQGGKVLFACAPRAAAAVPAICKDTTKRTFSCVTPPPAGYTLDATCNKACNGANDKYSYKAVVTDTGGGGGGGGTCSDPAYVKISGVCFPKDTGLPDPQGGILEVLGNFLGWLLAIFGFLAIGAFVVSGIQYLIAAGDDKMIEIAKRNMKWSVVGVLVGLSGWIIMMAVARALSASPLF